MQRDLLRLSRETFDLLIIGGGITGACVARDAALRGLKVALVEKNDFANATSAHNSKLIHGGLRYLRNFELGLVRESLRERRIWQRNAPHLVHPLPFLVPLYDAGVKDRATLAAGLTLYDILSYDRGRLDDPDQRLPGHSWLNRKRAVAREPMLDGHGFDGAFLYYDAQMYSPERLALECIIDAAAHGAAIANHVTAGGLLISNGKVEGASVREMFGGGEFDVRAKITLLAAGPWADVFLETALGKPSSHKLLRSKGIHLIVPSMTKTNALTVAADGSHFFVLPWRGHSLLGTTDTAFTDAPDNVGVSEKDIAGFLDFINAHLPSTRLSPRDVEHFYAGLRPLVDDGSNDTYGASRKAELIDHSGSDKLGGLFSAIGGKWTTSRHLAEKTVDVLVEKLGLRNRQSTTATAVTPGGNIARFKRFEAEMLKRHEPVPNITHLARMYGTRLDKVLALGRDKPELREVLSPSGDIGAQVLYAVREEMAMTLEDVVMRRTGIGQLGNPGSDAIDRTAELMTGALGWSAARKEREVAAVMSNFVTRPQ
jgi:glycerol-3-phosphate dehydrogenase